MLCWDEWGLTPKLTQTSLLVGKTRRTYRGVKKGILMNHSHHHLTPSLYGISFLGSLRKQHIRATCFIFFCLRIQSPWSAFLHVPLTPSITATTTIIATYTSTTTTVIYTHLTWENLKKSEAKK